MFLNRFRAHPRLPNPDERLELALDAGAIAGTWFWDVVNDRLTSDRRFARFFSMDEARLEAGVSLAEVVQSIHPDDEPRVQNLIGAALELGGPYQAEYRVRQSDGTYRWVEANGHVTRDANGKPLTFPGVLVDIDSRKTAEQLQAALVDLSDRLRSSDGIESTVRAASATCGTALQASRAGYGVVDLVDDSVEIRSDWRRDGTPSIAGRYRFREFGSFVDELRAGRVVAISDVLTDPRTAQHGTAFEPLAIRALLNVPLMKDGVLEGVLLVHDDVPRDWGDDEIHFASSIADRTWSAIATTEAVAKLRALNANLEQEVAARSADRGLIWSIARDLLLIARLDGVLTAVNPAWTATLGWEEAELVGSSLFDLIHPDDLDATRAGASAIGRDESLANFENRYRHKDGSYRWISWSASLGNGMIVGAGRDVSAAKELTAAQEQLRQSQKMEAVGQLTGGVAHDFNNLLTVISTSASLLKTRRASEEQRTRALDAIERTVKRASRLTSQLLAFARRQALTPVVFDASHNVSTVGEMLDMLVGARIRISTQLESRCFINADASQFDTALVNLVVNARDAMNGEGALSISVGHVDTMPAIRLHPAAKGHFVAVTVADNGSGISEGDLERIFEPFFTTKAVGHGTGLGLSQVFGFTKQSGGEVAVVSKPGQGSAFTMYFPLADDPAVSADDAFRSAPGKTGSDAAARVLVVEDNTEVANAVDASLQELGYHTEVVSNANAALTRLDAAAGQFDVMFSDVVMTGMDGIELAQEVRRRWPQMPVVLSSGYSHVLANDTSHGFDLLPKPYDIASLDAAICRALSQATAPSRTPRVGLTSAALQSMMDDAQSETARQAALDALRILDTPPEQDFDDLVRMAADICGTPIALVSLIDQHRQWFKARVGLDAQETPREHAFCAHAIQTPERLMVVEDASKDSRFASNPLVTGHPDIRFYAGAPLVDSGGHALGTLCVISPEARVLEPRQAQLLEHLAGEAVKRLEMRRERLGGNQGRSTGLDAAQEKS